MRELTGKEPVEDRVGLIIKSLVSLSEIVCSFFFRKFLLNSLACYIWIKSILLRSVATLSLYSCFKSCMFFYKFFFYVQDNIP